MNGKRAAGFTLIELMVVVVVIAILGAVAYPSYLDHVRKAKRAEGKTALLKAAQALERWYSDKSTYATTPAAAPVNIDLAPLFGLAAGAVVYSSEDPTNPGPNNVPATGPAAYTIAGVPEDVVNCPKEACFRIIATRNGTFIDDPCGDLTLTSTGTRSWSTSADPTTAARCRW